MVCVSECDEEQFSCSNGLCRPQYFVCDRVNDCGDNSDEEHCGEFLLLPFNEHIYLYQHLPFRIHLIHFYTFKDTLSTERQSRGRCFISTERDLNEVT